MADNMVTVTISADELALLRVGFEKSARKVTRTYARAIEAVAKAKTEYDTVISTAKNVYGFTDKEIEASDSLNPERVPAWGQSGDSS